MYLMYVDESGDPGTAGSPTRYFILSALIVHELTWQSLLDDLINFRRTLKGRFGLLMREEIHASQFIYNRAILKTPLTRNVRLDILKRCLDWTNQRTDVSIITVRIDKQIRADPFEYAWRMLIQRFDNTLAYKNFPGGHGNDKGILICDNTDGNKLTRLLRQMRRYNQVSNKISIATGSRNIPLRAIIEDPVLRNSKDSYILQLVDVIAYFARQVYETNKYIRLKGAKNFYGRVANVVNQHATHYATRFKIVEL